MMIVFSPIFVAATRIICGYKFEAPLRILTGKTQPQIKPIAYDKYFFSL